MKGKGVRHKHKYKHSTVYCRKCPRKAPINKQSQSGHTHVFVSEFASEAERNHYVREDPVHRAFVEKWILSSDSIVEKAFVVDFVAGQFEER